MNFKPTISAIFIYPVKSLSAVSVSQARVEERGLSYDRRWMVVDEEGNFITQRALPQMATVKATAGEAQIELSSEGLKGTLTLSHETASEESRKIVTVWGDECRAVDEGDEAAEWISGALGVRARIVRMPDSTERKVDPMFGDHIVSFADGYPLLAASVSSLDLLNSHLDDAVPMGRFRPNVVINGLEAFEEDEWDVVRIGNARFRSVKPCARCVVTTIDQDSGEKKGKEPLATLARLRSASEVMPARYESLGLNANDVLFGQNLIPLDPGAIIRQGDGVEVLSTV